MAKKRTVLRSKAGKKLYAVRDEKGEFTDIQSYQRAQSQDMKRTSKAELDQQAKAAEKAAKPAKAVKAKSAKKKKAKRSK